MKLIDYPSDKLIKGIFSGKITVKKLPVDLYADTYNHLKKGAREGLKGLVKNKKSQKLIHGINDNIYIFSGAKTYQQVRAISAELNKFPSFTQFKKVAEKTFKKFNEDWLKTEYNTAIGQAQSAKKWMDFEENKENFPLLEYSAVIDSKTSQICYPLNKVVLPVDHPFWNEHAPLNHFNCRCLLKPIGKTEKRRSTSERKVRFKTALLEGEIQPLFKMNPGKEMIIFKTEGKGRHPYFEVAKRDINLAKKNFNLPIPKADGKK